MFIWCNIAPLNTNLALFEYHMYLFIATIYPSCNDYISSMTMHCHKAQIASNWFHEHDRVQCSRPLQIRLEHLPDVVEQQIHGMNVPHGKSVAFSNYATQSCEHRLESRMEWKNSSHSKYWLCSLVALSRRFFFCIFWLHLWCILYSILYSFKTYSLSFDDGSDKG